MSDPKYKNIGSPVIHIIEECAEVIQAACKGDRFGWDNFHPDRPGQTNLQELEKEIEDVIEAFEDLKAEINKNGTE